ncbi:uncharacterized protein CcaverHIS019_0211620 [Cutaneotrichosporon cavernicola]|uniref:FAM192A/Fyv6 N-terminal domain-containing protein n=1 Tax=Cutaneotrichosporon cavernicola TaxID=279322 RepID=A0AA48I8I9_9TREE|nr:uncharacterized protein CcaverHIS019_0211620 [Cutaneotrichosporon cavernicola]BEI89800.1 hypothetical protein CcaverHIS019_0211620 [Cutaneotrichosporon cavernicola]BEI97571.1 hypothetical protein CcaverHIS631_0211600 [Cutaneotrichosporon cavernicola]BEJ05350.1 hypothetical protein CcaverHIS641_0211670 [Cutaneotrichosporon cavernicola]
MDNIETESRSALATGSIGARFISQNAVDEAKERREEEWKEAYERIGQEPPPLMKEEEHDGRTLFERLEEQKQLKQDWWDDRMKMKNQYRGLVGEEFEFLAEKDREKRDAERKVEEEVNVELQGYREARTKRAADAVAASEPQPASSAPKPPLKKTVPAKPAKKDMRSLMKGVVVKKKAAKPADKAADKTADKDKKRPAEDDAREAKRRA